ncbi:MAG TPA: hypothetical protein P5016_09840, partial [Verrucomicrobiales bacterium]|nr:hypothetical protein [Verrucomicrobiales bacterium]
MESTTALIGCLIATGAVISALLLKRRHRLISGIRSMSRTVDETDILFGLGDHSPVQVAAAAETLALPEAEPASMDEVVPLMEKPQIEA